MHSRRVRTGSSSWLLLGSTAFALVFRGLYGDLWIEELLTGLPGGPIGFLIAAKSILRYGTATRDQRTAEYVIIGTLASFGWAIVMALTTQAALSLLPPLEIAALTP